VYCGSAKSGSDEFACGINYQSFSRRVEEGLHPRESLVVGSCCYYKPNEVILLFRDWTEFDGYIVKCSNDSQYSTATVTKDGLLFATNSIVLKKGFKSTTVNDYLIM